AQAGAVARPALRRRRRRNRGSRSDERERDLRALRRALLPRWRAAGDRAAARCPAGGDRHWRRRLRPARNPRADPRARDRRVARQRRRHAGRARRPQGHAPAAARRRPGGDRRAHPGRARAGLCRGADQGHERRRTPRRGGQPHPPGARRMAVIPVELAGRAYEVRVGGGLLADVAGQCGGLLRKPRVPVVTDVNVAAHWRRTVDASLTAAGFEPRWLVLEPGEGAKSWAVLERLTDWLLAEEVERGDHVLALGGGVIGDLTGFAAAILKRGCGFV